MPSSQETEREARIWPPSPKSKCRGYERRRVKGILEVLDKLDSRKEPQPTGRLETFHKPRTGNASCLGGAGDWLDFRTHLIEKVLLSLAAVHPYPLVTFPSQWSFLRLQGRLRPLCSPRSLPTGRAKSSPCAFRVMASS